MNREQLKNLIRSLGIPHFVTPRCTVHNAFDYYRIGAFTVWRCTNSKKKIIRIDSKLQKKIFKALLNVRKPVEPYVIGISSEPNDIFAYEFTGILFYHWLKKIPDLNFEWVNPAKPLPKVDTDPDVVFIYNVMSDAGNYRAQKVRDTILNYNNSLRIVILGGTPALLYFDKELKSGLSGMVHIKGKDIDFSDSGIKEIDAVTEKGKTYTKQVFSTEIQGLLKKLNIPDGE